MTTVPLARVAAWLDAHYPGRRCPVCRGRLFVLPPDTAEGRIVCILCGRAVADVVREAPHPFGYGEPAIRGRPRLTETEREASNRRQREYQRAWRIRKKMSLARGERWAAGWDACVECGRTDSPHNSRGQCARCRIRQFRRRAGEDVAS